MRYAALFLLGATACHVAAEPVDAPSELRPEMVTGTAAARLGADGRFRFPSPFLVAGQMTLATAREQTLQFAKYMTNRVLLRGIPEGQRGRWIDPHLLVSCADAWFVHSQIRLLELDTFPAPVATAVRQMHGPHWLLPLCNDKGIAEMTVEVAIDDNDVVFRDNRPVRTDTFDLLAAYAPAGVPDTWSAALPISAEQAARFAWDRTGVPVAEVPELFARGAVEFEGGAFSHRMRTGAARGCNRWRVVLAREVLFVGKASGTRVRSREAWVGTRECAFLDRVPVLQVALPLQPGASWIAYAATRVPIAFVSPIFFEEALEG